MSFFRSSDDSARTTSPDDENYNPKALLDSENIVALTKTRSLREQVLDDHNQTIEEEQYISNHPKELLKRELSVDEALSIIRPHSLQNSALQETTDLEKKSTNISTKTTIDEYRDGGYGWVTVLSAWLVMFNTWGNSASSGVYLSYYISNDVFPGATSKDFAYLAGSVVCCGQIFAPFALISSSFFGLKATMFGALVLHFIGFILASFATKLWHLFVCQGVLIGISYAFMFVPSTAVIPSWFLKKRAIALGIVLSGTGFGGLVYSLSINALIQKTGNQRWALRMTAVMATVLLSLAVYLIRFPKPQPREKLSWESLKGTMKAVLYNKNVWKSTQVYYVSIWFLLALFGYNLIVFSYASAATALGLSQHQASVLTAMVNVGQIIGRPSMGFIADRWVGRINHCLLLNFILIILIFAFWLNITTFIPLIICGVLLGYLLGIANVMNTTFIADSVIPSEFAAAWSILNVAVAPIVLFVEVIALDLRDNSRKNPFRNTQIFSGCVYFAALFFLVLFRQWKVERVLIQRRKNSDKQLNLLIQKGEEKSEEASSLRKRIGKYDELLEQTSLGYFKRLTYPIKL
ncbi:hypothetical protein WICMUC_002200 [Wickerhamomyces mucosus]|uniref:Major facilitator superfamily (MFS) profile domain-containing protein n=1 Tax=Wickerhamomyces mucosus TaxID=1378264 RepID=A0A9P8PQ08_9ASCO|nr:hypothetical protein WICMUC_002200 [Wickerhamomyces mucosus]